MRQLSPPTNLLLACLAAFGLLGSLGLPWYAPPHATPAVDLTEVANGKGDGPMQHFAQYVGRMFSSTGLTYDGSEALGSARTLLIVLAGLVIVLSVAVVVPALRDALRDVLRAVSLATPVIIGVLAARHPGGHHLEVRWGLLVGLACTLLMASAAWHGSAVRLKKAMPHITPWVAR